MTRPRQPPKSSCKHPRFIQKIPQDADILASCLLVSQDRHQIFLTFATYDEDYIAYVSGNLEAEVRQSWESASNPFLRMNEFRPFETTSQSHMKSLGNIILAFTIRVCDDTDGADVGKQEETGGKGKASRLKTKLMGKMPWSKKKN